MDWLKRYLDLECQLLKARTLEDYRDDDDDILDRMDTVWFMMSDDQIAKHAVLCRKLPKLSLRKDLSRDEVNRLAAEEIQHIVNNYEATA